MRIRVLCFILGILLSLYAQGRTPRMLGEPTSHYSEVERARWRLTAQLSLKQTHSFTPAPSTLQTPPSRSKRVHLCIRLQEDRLSAVLSTCVPVKSPRNELPPFRSPSIQILSSTLRRHIFFALTWSSPRFLRMRRTAPSWFSLQWKQSSQAARKNILPSKPLVSTRPWRIAWTEIRGGKKSAKRSGRNFRTFVQPINGKSLRRSRLISGATWPLNPAWLSVGFALCLKFQYCFTCVYDLDHSSL